jgi:hypothetical protein
MRSFRHSNHMIDANVGRTDFEHNHRERFMASRNLPGQPGNASRVLQDWFGFASVIRRAA